MNTSLLVGWYMHSAIFTEEFTHMERRKDGGRREVRGKAREER